MSEDLKVFDVIAKLGVAGRPLEKHELREVSRLAEAAKAVLEEAACDLIPSSQKRPVLFEYCGDGTPLKLRHEFQVSFAEHQKCVRSGYTGDDLYCQGAFVRSLNNDGEPVVACLLKEPRLMAGKSALHAFNGLIEFFPTLDQVDHEGFNIHHYSWDRALFSACRTHARKYHTVILRRIVDRSPRQSGTMKVLQSWLLCTGCGLHDIHNGFSWGISKLLQSKDMVDELYIRVESLRNVDKHLQSHLSSWLVGVVLFDDISVERDTLHSLWTALDVPPELCNMLADRGVLWQDGRLRVSKACRDVPDIMAWLYNALMTVFRFKKYASNRWISVGTSLRTLVAACALGVRQLHQFTMDDDKVGSYYLGGFSKLSGPMRYFCVVAAISSRPTEALSLALLEDDRAVRNVEAYEACLHEEMDWMQNLTLPVWELLELVACTSDSSCRAIRSDCLDCAHTSCSYTFKNFLQQVRSLPWSLAIGDVAVNLDTFAASTAPVEDPVAKKIKTLLGLKFNRPQLVEAVSMLKDCRWSTAFAEQLHAHAAVLHRLHREYGPETLCSRTMVSFLKLFIGSDPIVKQEEKARKKLSLLGRKQPERASGRSHFVGSFAHEAKSVVASQRTLTPEETQAHWTAGGERWNALTAPQKRAFEATASASSDSKRLCLVADKAKVKSDLALAQRRAAHELLAEGVQSRVSSCRFTQAQRGRLQFYFDSYLRPRRFGQN